MFNIIMTIFISLFLVPRISCLSLPPLLSQYCPSIVAENTPSFLNFMAETDLAETIAPRQELVDLASLDNGIVVFPSWLCRVEGKKHYPLLMGFNHHSTVDNCAGAWKNHALLFRFKRRSM
jgi:hypothetical protein